MWKTNTKRLAFPIILVATIILFSQKLITPSDRTPYSLLSSFNVLMLGKGKLENHHESHQMAVDLDTADSYAPVNHTFVEFRGNTAQPDFGGLNTSIHVSMTMNEFNDDILKSHNGPNFRHKSIANISNYDPEGKHESEKVNVLSNRDHETDGFAFLPERIPRNDSTLDSELKQNNNSGFLSLQPFPTTISNHLAPTLQPNDLLNTSSGMASQVADSTSLHNLSTQNISNNLTKPLLQDSQPTIVKNSPEEMEIILKKNRRAPSVSISISDINLKLLNNIAFPNTVKPRWTSQVDHQIVEAATKIRSAPLMTVQTELYAPAFRNITAFTRSYELMDGMLKVYIYQEGKKPIFHQPRLRGIYASEGWFMKQMEESRHFRVKDPSKAHLFYLPFSSVNLRNTGSPGAGKKKLVKYLKSYLDLIAVKHPFWNRTYGADHFLAGCHDWAPYMTKRYFVHSIRALCNADASKDFQLGKDVSLPTTNMILTMNPPRQVSDELSANKRPTLAFFAGRPHGYLRNMLFELWENNDPDFKIYGRSLQGPTGKAYMKQMKTSKYCLCPRGYEVHTPRVVESILYGCIPVIISDNYVPPFFEVLNWEEFAVFIAEKDIGRLKNILLSIPPRKYLAMRTVVNKVRRHFVWHASPVKYDIFHMILHSVWNSRLYRVRI